MEKPGHQQLPWVIWNTSYQMLSDKRQEWICWILLEHSCRPNLKIGYLWSWTVGMQTIFQNIPFILEEPWDYWNLCMEWLNLEGYFLVSWNIGWLMKQASNNLNARCLYIISMHQMGGNVVISYVDDCVYCYTSESLGKWFVDTLGKRFHFKFLVFAHCFMLIRIS